MNFIEQDSRNDVPPLVGDGKGDANYFAFFDKPTPENLSANHGGILTQQQHTAIEARIGNQKVTIAIFVGMSVCAVLFMIFLFGKIDALDGVISFNAQLINAAVSLLVFGIFTHALVGDWFVLLAGDDLVNGVVESAVGRIEWSGRRYQMRTDSRLLRSMRSTVALPPPGEYRFYYLPETGLVVMAEQLRKASADETSPRLFDALASANDFSPEDLSQNQSGLLTRHQENRLFRLVAFFGVILLGSVVLLVSMISQIVRALSTTSTVLILIIGGVLFLRIGWNVVQLVADLWNGRVSSVEGPVVRQYRRSRYHRTHYYVTGSHKFEVSAAAYNALIEGQQYRIWYVPRSKQLVSIEPI